MPAGTGAAPGKVILFGEHAAVYGQPAIAVPVQQVTARALVRPLFNAPSGRIRILAPEVGFEADLSEMDAQHPLAAAVRFTLEAMGVEHPLAVTIRISSTIPVAAGLGSGAAVSVAIARALSGFLGHPLNDEQVSAVAFEVEKIHHGTPSGIDNTVITYNRPVYFIKGQPLQTFTLGAPLNLVIADTGIPSPTKVTVGDVRASWEAEPERYDALFAEIGAIAKTARGALERGELATLGELMNRNHSLLQDLGVSSPELDSLVAAARAAGALGAKLSGGGRGGNMVALTNGDPAALQSQLHAAGARSSLHTVVV
ncbi:MAG: mevalonate kinase [Anaerolineales bacterium]|nr:MAG: mevalonate kinase [Anaerolineales bacterium]